MSVRTLYHHSNSEFISTLRESDLTDVEVLLVGLNSTLFPGVPSGAEAHDGFLDEHEKTASTLLSQVQTLMSAKNTNNVVAVSFGPIIII